MWEGWEDGKKSDKMYVSKSFKEKRGQLIFKQHYKVILPDPEVSSGPSPREAPVVAVCGFASQCSRASSGNKASLGPVTCRAVASRRGCSWPAELQRMTALYSPASSGAMSRLGHVYHDAKMTSASCTYRNKG